MRVSYETLDNWAKGVVTALQAHALDPAASPRAWNTILNGGNGLASLAKRHGLRMANATPVTGSPAILGQVDFRRSSGAMLTPYHLLVSDGGRLDKLQADDTTTAADALNATPFTAGTKYPDFAIARNFLYIVNGTDAKKFDGTSVFNFSMATPSAPSSVVDSGVAGTPNGTYEVVLAYYNSNTGYYSSSSSVVSVTVASKQIDVTWSAPADTQVTHVVVGIRCTAGACAAQPYFYEVTKVAVGTTTYRINVSTATLITRMPDFDENDPLPASIRAIEWHAGANRMFATDGDQLYYSGRDKPEAFDPESIEPVGKNDGQKIVGLHYEHGVLLIFKTRSTYVLIGLDPAEWRVELLDAGVGLASHRAIASAEGITYWYSEQGAQAWPGAGPVVNITKNLRPSVAPDQLNVSLFSGITVAPDVENKLVLFAVPEVGQTRNTKIFPWNYELGAWASDLWNPMDVASLALIRKVSDDTPRVYLGGHAGQVFVFDVGVHNDGLPSGTTKAGTITGATASTLGDTNATFTTTGGKLIERYVTAIDPAHTRVQRRRITSNTSNELVVTPDWSTVPNTEWTYVIGGPEFQLDTRWNAGNPPLPFVKKRFMFFNVLGGSQNSGVGVEVHLFLDFNLAATAPDKILTATITGSGAKWGSAKWGQSQWGGVVPSVPNRLRVAKTGTHWRARLINRQPDQNVQIYALGMQSELLSDKLS